MKDAAKNIYIERMTENLPVLRAKLGVTQADLAEIAGISRQTILSVEKKQRGMTWNMFLALLYIFTANEKTAPLVDLFEIRTEELQLSMITKK
ncbi:MAG: helix-turn-helix domain-containing protein [Oscillospiraceae bacterium]|nr:helix-turn-helix domain-containing protein [Oscillospiraceae bacterium]